MFGGAVIGLVLFVGWEVAMSLHVMRRHDAARKKWEAAWERNLAARRRALGLEPDGRYGRLTYEEERDER